MDVLLQSMWYKRPQVFTKKEKKNSNQKVWNHSDTPFELDIQGGPKINYRCFSAVIKTKNNK